ncbi:MAG: nucleoside deaminase [Candidatus Omnitrophota bacterium]
MKDKKFMGIAIKEAYLGIKKKHGGPFGAVIVKNGKVLAKAHNNVLSENDPTRHAELIAISCAAKKSGTYDLSDCEIYSTTEPCPMCFSAVHWARINTLIYGTGIKDVKKLGFNELTISSRSMKKQGGTQLKIRSGIMRKECEELLEYWNALSDKITY